MTKETVGFRNGDDGPDPTPTWATDIEYLDRRAVEVEDAPRLSRRYRDAAAAVRGDGRWPARYSPTPSMPRSAVASDGQRPLRMKEGEGGT